MSQSIMYAIAFDFDMDILEKVYPNPLWKNAYIDVKNVFESLGFSHYQGNMYIHNEGNPVQCVLAVQKVNRIHPWFKSSIKKITMLRIQEQVDLSLAF